MWGYQLYFASWPSQRRALCFSSPQSFKFLAPAIWAEEVWDKSRRPGFMPQTTTSSSWSRTLFWEARWQIWFKAFQKSRKTFPETMKNVTLSVIFAPWPSLSLGHAIWESQKRSLVWWEVWRRLTVKWNSLMKTQFSPMCYNNKKERNQSRLACIFRGWKVLIA